MKKKHSFVQGGRALGAADVAHEVHAVREASDVASGNGLDSDGKEGDDMHDVEHAPQRVPDFPVGNRTWAICNNNKNNDPDEVSNGKQAARKFPRR